MRVALVHADTNSLPESLQGLEFRDPWLSAALEAIEIEPCWLPWTADEVWEDYDAVIVRSTWDYYLRLPEFLDWITRLSGNVVMWNDPEILMWNMHKSYLLSLSDGGLPVVPTALVPVGYDSNHKHGIQTRGWDPAGVDDLVIKPAVSGGGHGTIRVRGRDLDSAVEQIAGMGDLLIQPFLSEILSTGERSVVVIGGAVSHVVAKRSAGDEFRVQAHFGGTESLEPVTAGEQALVECLLAELHRTHRTVPLFMRVDLIASANGPLISEVELLEPDLFFGLAPHAANELAVVVRRRLVGASSALVNR